MRKFIGEHNVKVDDKGRIILPAAFKNILSEDEDRTFVVRKDTALQCLEMYTAEEWDKQASLVRDQLDLAFNDEHRNFWRAYTHNCAIVEPDAKVGRFSIPKKLLELIGVEKEVIFYGNDHKIEIWAKENFESSIISTEEFKSIAKKLSNR